METHSLEKTKLLPKNKAEIKLFSESLSKSLKEGEINPLQLLATFKAFEKVIEMVKPTLDKLAIAEVEKYSSKEVIAPYNGCEFKIRDNSRWKYDHCNDDEYNLLKAEESVIKEKIKQRETFLQTLRKPLEVVDEETGEIKTIAPAIKVGGSSIVTTFV